MSLIRLTAASFAGIIGVGYLLMKYTTPTDEELVKVDYVF